MTLIFPSLITARFRVQSVTLDGSNDYLSKVADFDGNADSKNVSGSMWLKFNGGDGSDQYIMNADIANARRPEIYKDTSNKINISYRDPGGGGTFTSAIKTTTSVTAASGWKHVLWSFNGTTQHLYLTGASDLTSTANVDATSDLTLSPWAVGADSDGNAKLNADIAELWIAHGVYIDLSQAANREKFITNGKPVDLGTDGSTPTGSAPTVYLSVRPGDAATAFATNRGTGGNFTINGTLDLSATSPSD